MKIKKKLGCVLSLFLLCACSGEASSTSFSSSIEASSISSLIAHSSETSSSLDESTQSSSLEQGSSSSEVESSIELDYQTIRQIKDRAPTTIEENDVGVMETNIKVRLKATLYACLDAITTKNGYGDRYKILMLDETGYIYLKVPQTVYTYLSKYEDNYGVYDITGTLSFYNKELEITVEEKPFYLPDETQNIDVSSLSKEATLQEVYGELSTIKTNCKGCAFTDLVKLKLKCLANDFENSNVYFTDGQDIILVHGSDKLYKKFLIGNVYTLVGAKTLFNYKPGLEYVWSQVLEEELDFNIENITTKTCADFYQYSYKTDTNNDYKEYRNLFQKPYLVEAYVNLYEKDGRYNVIFEDQYNEEPYQTYQTASNQKALFLKNENCLKISSIKDEEHCEYLTYYELGTKTQFVVFPYLWNTNHYFQVYSYLIINV